MADAQETSKNRAIVTVLGKDAPGIVAAVASTLARQNVNILDITQTILSGIFTMTMFVELSDGANFSSVKTDLEELAGQLNVQVNMEREEVFTYMYRI
ncbi:ACT domain-containing protein [Atopobium sp. oral taxon 199]|uniref:ACT domain-containing protein n=1 Tax=Atopobium sp. oral taxon 199 TaxID=712156 RepID=UPI00034E02DF|nr:ACT domain-containing protein [Atopobium sp. oral taxon 199]EPD78319.1 ACT domain-containing protein [Atopobium sp. oral taxon 199 str. F0494]